MICVKCGIRDVESLSTSKKGRSPITCLECRTQWKPKKKFIGRPRDAVRERDKQTCQMCGKKWKEGMRRFDVHHLEEKMRGKAKSLGTYKYDKENMDKLITFCHKCHFVWHSERGHFGGKSYPLLK